MRTDQNPSAPEIPLPALLLKGTAILFYLLFAVVSLVLTYEVFTRPTPPPREADPDWGSPPHMMRALVVALTSIVCFCISVAPNRWVVTKPSFFYCVLAVSAMPFIRVLDLLFASPSSSDIGASLLMGTVWLALIAYLHCSLLRAHRHFFLTGRSGYF